LILKLLGSAAAEAWPALFCHCDACAQARELGGKNVRRRTSYRLGDHIQIDWGPDTLGAYLAYGLDMTLVSDLLITHNHEDHFTAFELFYRRPGFGSVPEDCIMNVHGPQGVRDELLGVLKDEALHRLRSHVLEPYVEAELADGVRVVPIEASHATDVGSSFNYIIRVGDRTLLIGNDTGWWQPHVWDFLAGFRFDVVVLDCTYVALQQRSGHLGCQDVAEARVELESIGALNEGCRFIANHFSHNGRWLHHEMEEFFGPHGIQVGFDGMEVEI